MLHFFCFYFNFSFIVLCFFHSHREMCLELLNKIQVLAANIIHRLLCRSDYHLFVWSGWSGQWRRASVLASLQVYASYSLPDMLTSISSFLFVSLLTATPFWWIPRIMLVAWREFMLNNLIFSKLSDPLNDYSVGEATKFNWIGGQKIERVKISRTVICLKIAVWGSK